MAISSVETTQMRHVGAFNSSATAPISLLAPSTFTKDQMEIVLDDDRPYYTNLDEVRGTVRYSKDLSVEGTVLLVCLMGISQVIQLEWQQRTANYSTVHTEWPFLKDTKQVDIDMERCQSSFSFRIPSFLQPHQCPLGHLHHMELPPSSDDSSAESHRDCTMSGSNLWQIAYQIRAELVPLDDPKALKHVRLPIQFRPQAKIPREFLRREDVTTTQMSMEKLTNYLGQSQGTITLSAPNETTLRIPESRTDSIPLSLTLRYRGCNPPRITKIVPVLLSRTYKRTRHDPVSYHDESRACVSRELKTVCVQDNDIPSWTASNTELHTYDTQLEIPVHLLDKTQSSVLPSFESCLVSRRYALQLTLSFASSSTIPLRSRSFEFPIVLESTITSRMTQATVEEPIEEGEKVPTYEDTMQFRTAVAPITRVPDYTDPIPDFELRRLPYWSEKAAIVAVDTVLSTIPACARAC